MKTTYVDSYDREASLPVPCSIYVWEIDSPVARELIEVVEVKWNGEEWWVLTKTLLPRENPLGMWPGEPVVHRNDLSRFWEAVTPVRERYGQDLVRAEAFTKYEESLTEA